jgi:hypothetical protein
VTALTQYSNGVAVTVESHVIDFDERRGRPIAQSLHDGADPPTTLRTALKKILGKG